MKNFVRLNDFEKGFVQSLYKIRNGKFNLTTKQLAVLDKTYEAHKDSKPEILEIPTTDGGHVCLTEEIFNSGASAKGGWSTAQLACFGERFEKGWRDRIIGEYYPKSVIDKFLSLRSVKGKPTHRSNIPKTKAPSNQEIIITPKDHDEIIELAIAAAEDWNSDKLVAWFKNKFKK